MAEQSTLAALGLRTGQLGSSASLAICAPLANGSVDPACHTDAARIGIFFDRTAGSEAMGVVCGGVTGPTYTRSGTVVNAVYTGSITAKSGALVGIAMVPQGGAANFTGSLTTVLLSGNRTYTFPDYSTSIVGGTVGSTQVAYGTATNLTSDSGFTRTALALVLDANTDNTLTTGYGKMGGGPFTGAFTIAQASCYNATDYALYQDNTGLTLLNAKTGKNIGLRVNNVQKFNLTATAATFLSGVPVTASDTTDGTSGTAGAINTLGGIGVTKSIWGGANLTITGIAGIGGATNAGNVLNVGAANPLSGTVQTAVGALSFVGTSAATTAIRGLQFNCSTAVAAFTCTELTTINAGAYNAGAGSTITRGYGIRIAQSTAGGTANVGLAYGSALAEAGNFFIYDNTTDASSLGGVLTVRNTTASTTTTGALVVGNGTAATTCTFGGGNGNVGGNLTMTGATATLKVGGDTSTGPIIAVNGAAGNSRPVTFQTASVTRWQLICNNVAEGGSDAGSNLFFSAYNDAGTFIDNPITISRAAGTLISVNRPTQMTTASASGCLTLNCNTVAATPAAFINGTATITGAITDGYMAATRIAPIYNGAFTVTRHNYLDINNITGTSTITDACLFRTNAAIGTHKMIDAATTKTTPGGVDAWIKWNSNGTVVYIPAYLSKTA